MSYLQQYLNTIEAEAAERSRLACANAALIELAGEVMARINAAADRDAVHATYHLDLSTGACVTLQKMPATSNDELIDALEAAGFPVCHLPVRIARNVFTGNREVYLMVAPRIELRMHPPVPRVAGAQEVAEAA